MKKALVIGAGKIARGFIGQLLYLSGFEIVFVDVSDDLVDLLNSFSTYRVHVMGADNRDSLVDGYKALHVRDSEEICRAFYESDVTFVSVGGKNLESVGEILALALNSAGVRSVERTIVACENWKDAGEVLRRAIVSNLTSENAHRFSEYVGVSEAVMMRTATQPDAGLAKRHPLDVWVQNFWYLPIDANCVRGSFPSIDSVELIDDFGNLLTQKMYTNNTSNAIIAYTGYLLGYVYIADAANSPEIQELLDVAYPCINATLEAELGVSPKKQEEFSHRARDKYCDNAIVDKVIRHAKDPLRKLGPEDRLVAPARMALRHGIDATVFTDTIAKALFFDEASDESAMRLRRMRHEQGIEYVLKTVCELDEDEPLFALVLQGVDRIRQTGLVVGHE